ncbi:hypothetical protein CB0940_04452 [Cercospora beticola]|uniref:Uncharacterized protein n=1 Tax=Cercospora beticola TaxID=122368 RepID=A0A2G5HJ45_CERBT|nr:hypothetical protein CB0940_04452 [Cercospora beticola]PIA92581.1 hypothetical protein CB0940_04452 [Cercospora beticola]WPB01695.1 hypothetical protein RHO25_006325 [Cercospora beticola]CAK1363490.1 unnamed protein product [Cercospora beticola]
MQALNRPHTAVLSQGPESMTPPEGSNQARALPEEGFFRLVSLDTDSADDIELYNRMKIEAAAGLQRLSRSVGNEDPSEEAFRAEILLIYQDASSQTKSVYDRGALRVDGAMTDNWVIRWLLWQAMHQPNGR